MKNVNHNLKYRIRTFRYKYNLSETQYHKLKIINKQNTKFFEKSPNKINFAF